MTVPLTLARLEELEALEKTATPAGWMDGSHVGAPEAIVTEANPMMSLLGLDRDEMAIFMRKEDAAISVMARNALPQLLAAARCLHGELERWRDIGKSDIRLDGSVSPARAHIERIAAALGMEP